ERNLAKNKMDFIGFYYPYANTHAHRPPNIHTHTTHHTHTHTHTHTHFLFSSFLSTHALPHSSRPPSPVDTPLSSFPSGEQREVGGAAAPLPCTTTLPAVRKQAQ